MEEFAKKLGIPYPGEVVNNKLIIPLVDSDEYSKMYTLLDKSDMVDLDTSATLVTEKVSELLYLSDEYDVKLVANFSDNLYKIVISPAED